MNRSPRSTCEARADLDNKRVSAYNPEHLPVPIPLFAGAEKQPKPKEVTKPVGDKSPKSVHKQAAQKQSKAVTTKSKKDAATAAAAAAPSASSAKK